MYYNDNDYKFINKYIEEGSSTFINPKYFHIMYDSPDFFHNIDRFEIIKKEDTYIKFKIGDLNYLYVPYNYQAILEQLETDLFDNENEGSWDYYFSPDYNKLAEEVCIKAISEDICTQCAYFCPPDGLHAIHFFIDGYRDENHFKVIKFCYENGLLDKGKEQIFKEQFNFVYHEWKDYAYENNLTIKYPKCSTKLEYYIERIKETQ